MANTVYEALNSLKLIHYGAHISGETLRSIAGIEEIDEEELKDLSVDQIRRHFINQDLKELNIIANLRDELIKQGMYIKATGRDYRILLPSENLNQVANYMRSADRKLQRARDLQHHTPKQPQATPDQTLTRLYAKMNSSKEQQNRYLKSM